MNISDEGTIREYYDLRKQLDGFSEDMQVVMSQPNYSLKFTNPGRLVHVKHMNYDFGWGIVVNYKERRQPRNMTEEIPPHQKYVVDILLKVPDGTSVGTKTFQDLPAGVRPPKDGEKCVMEVVPVMLNCIHAFGHFRLKLPDELRSAESRNSAMRILNEAIRRFPDGVPVLDPIENMGIKDESFKKLLRVRQARWIRMREDANEDTENRGPRVSTFLKPLAQFTAAAGTIRAVFQKGGIELEDKGNEEEDLPGHVHHTA